MILPQLITIRGACMNINITGLPFKAISRLLIDFLVKKCLRVYEKRDSRTRPDLPIHKATSREACLLVS